MRIRDLYVELPKVKREEAIWILGEVLGKSRSELLLQAQDSLEPKDIKKFKLLWSRRQNGEPIQYILGKGYFWGREFLVNKNVLIPRPETERLVELALSLMGNHEKVLDIGTGSGAIGITIQMEKPDTEVWATDISNLALNQAKENAKKMGARIVFSKADVFPAELQREKFSIVISNPPYRDVKEWEPTLALEPEERHRGVGRSLRGSWIAEKILQACINFPPKYTLMELSPKVAYALERQWQKRAQVKKIWRESDLAGRKRFLLVAWRHG